MGKHPPVCHGDPDLMVRDEDLQVRRRCLACRLVWHFTNGFGEPVGVMALRHPNDIRDNSQEIQTVPSGGSATVLACLLPTAIQYWESGRAPADTPAMRAAKQRIMAAQVAWVPEGAILRSPVRGSAPAGTYWYFKDAGLWVWPAPRNMEWIEEPGAWPNLPPGLLRAGAIHTPIVGR